MNVWTKKLDVLHVSGKDSRTICGKAMLGNNYAEFFPDREKCEVCFK